MAAAGAACAVVPAMALTDQAPPESQVDKDRLLAELKSLPTERAANGREEHLAGLRQTEDLLIDKLKQIGYTPTIHEFDFLGSSRQTDEKGDRLPNRPWRNIIVDIPGKTREAEMLVFTAHFDAVPRSPGADDDGSGTVAILEMARLLKDRPMQRTLRLCLFNCEEVGLVGSRAYVQSIMEEIKPSRPKVEGGGPGADGQVPPPPAPKYRILGMASLDGIAYFSDAPNSQKSPIPDSDLFKSPTVGDFIGVATILKHRRWSRALDKAMRDSAPNLKTVVVDFLPIAPPDLLRSDHAPFMAAGVPALILADTANFRSPHYHQPTDTFDTIDWVRYTDVVRGVVGAAYRLCGPVGGELIELDTPKKKVAAEAAPEPAKPAEAPVIPAAQ